jgi:tetratricopeptide (TPR) repeat protein
VKRSLILFLICSGSSATAFAYDFVPSDPEFLAWPAYCKVVYTRTNIGSTTKFVRSIGSRELEESKRYLSNQRFGIGGLHHFCAGAAWLNRYRFETDDRLKRHMIEQAFTETSYTHQRVGAKDPLFAEISAQLASVLFEMDQSDEALAVLDAAILAAPENSLTYTVKGVILYRLGKLKEALESLSAGNETLAGKSPEIHYNLGLILLELNKPEKALEHGRMAYRMGYPLQGLKRKLITAGVWN